MIDEKISVIIPAHNEADNIISTLNETIRVLSRLDCDYEIIVVDDGSNDGTADLVKSNYDFKKDKVRVESYALNAGKGNAIKYGTKFAVGDLILFLDADLDLHPNHLPAFLDKMKKTNADAVIGSKKSRDSKVRYSLKRKILSNGYYYLIKILFGLPIKDTQTGIKLFKGKALKEAIGKVSVKGYAFDLELLIILHKKGYKIAECAVQVTQARLSGRIGQRDAISVFKDTLKIFNRLYFKKSYS